MTQEKKWLKRYQEIVEFINGNNRNPSKYVPEERGMVNWCKQQRKLFNAGILKPERVEPFKKLLMLKEENKRKNQYE